jgi:flagellar hook-basal body complex protein FliE
MDATALLAATRAYSSAGKSPIDAGDANVGSANGANFGGFAEVLQKTVTDTINQSKEAEAAGQRAAVGKAELVDVVTAISSAEVQLETMVAMRNQVIQAYQEVMRMPI